MFARRGWWWLAILRRARCCRESCGRGRRSFFQPPRFLWLRASPALLDGWLDGLSCDGELFFEALFFEEAGVVAVAGKEFVVSAKFNDAAGYEDGDLVGVATGGDAV